MSKPRVVLISWDPDSPEHIDRMIAQRRACGWNAQLVSTEWTKAHSKGEKCIYWIAFPEIEVHREKYLTMHTEQYPEEASELRDTSKTLLALPRAPSSQMFVPIGHITLAMHDPASIDGLGLSVPDSGSYWIKSLYISYVLQGLGLGNAAMKIAESIAAQEPLNARHLLLDTLSHADHSNKEFVQAYFGGLFKVPTQAWYERHGYKLIGTVENLYKVPDANGKIWPCTTVFLQKDLI